MTTTDLTIQQDRTALAEQIEFAKLATSGSGQSILPDIYRGNPANVIIAVGLGASMGLSPAESLYRISVIKGKPSAGAELIAANVRKAGHKLRVRGDEQSCTATIVRADDPDYEFTVTRDMAWARTMGLASNDNYKKQPGTMLQWRAITAVARLACPEALYGVAYTPDELTEQRPEPKPQAAGKNALVAAVRPAAATAATAATESETDEEGEPVEPLSDRTRNHMFALLGDLGITDPDVQRAGMSTILGREVTSRGDLTEDEGRTIVIDLEARASQPTGDDQ